jgi:2-dehydropantoate 2-reductase
VIVYGAGAIGATVGGWLAEAGHAVTFVARPEAANTINEQGLRLQAPGQVSHQRLANVRAVSDLRDAPAAECIVVAVKNYQLDAAAQDIRDSLDREPIVVALQNGLENQRILPRFFAKVVYGVVCYNAWRDGANLFGFQNRGPILLGVLDRAFIEERDRVVRGFTPAFACRPEERIGDAMKCKMAINLANSVTALVGLGVRPIEDIGALKRSVTNVLYEGTLILQRAGVREVSLEHAPGWRTIRATVKLPGFITTRIFKRNLAKVRMSSMGQDVYVLKRGETEIESLNGYFVRLAESVGFNAPYNNALYRITREWLARPEPRPMHERELWSLLQAR